MIGIILKDVVVVVVFVYYCEKVNVAVSKNDGSVPLEYVFMFCYPCKLQHISVLALDLPQCKEMYY